MTDASDDSTPSSPIIQRIRTAATTANDSPFIADWDTLLGLAANGMGNDRDVMRCYLVYEIEQASGRLEHPGRKRG